MLPGLHIPDVSEFQSVNWAAFAGEAVIIRADYGTAHQDQHWTVNLPAARARASIKAIGIYDYLVQSQDPVAQANVFCDAIEAQGGLRTNEWVICDSEEGAGDQRARVAAWFAQVRARLGTRPAQEWDYSYGPFVQAHLEDTVAWITNAGRLFWLAGYVNPEPEVFQHALWQHTDGQFGDTGCQPWAGIGRCDCSVFHGTVDDLLHLIGATPTPPEAAMSIWDSAHASDADRDDYVRGFYVACYGSEPSVSELNFCKWCLGAGATGVAKGVFDSASGQAARANRLPQAT